MSMSCVCVCVKVSLYGTFGILKNYFVCNTPANGTKATLRGC